MPTQTKENYLKAIYFLDLKNPTITVTDLSREMEVSAPTVNNMIKKLTELGWVEYERYKPLKITEKGRKLAALIIRKHRLAEMFLTEIMGMGWEEVHDIAEDIEHIQSERFFDRMDELLNYPSTDPHGSPIPDKHGNVEIVKYRSLSDLKSGEKAVLVSVKDSSTDFLSYLNARDISLGMSIEVMDVEPFDHSMNVRFSEFESIMLSHEVCRRLLVE